MKTSYTSASDSLKIVFSALSPWPVELVFCSAIFFSDAASIRRSSNFIAALRVGLCSRSFFFASSSGASTPPLPAASLPAASLPAASLPAASLPSLPPVAAAVTLCPRSRLKRRIQSRISASTAAAEFLPPRCSRLLIADSMPSS